MRKIMLLILMGLMLGSKLYAYDDSHKVIVAYFLDEKSNEVLKFLGPWVVVEENENFYKLWLNVKYQEIYQDVGLAVYKDPAKRRKIMQYNYDCRTNGFLSLGSSDIWTPIGEVWIQLWEDGNRVKEGKLCVQ